MSKLKTLLEAVKRKRADASVRPDTFRIRFFKVNKEGGKPHEIADQFLLRQDGVYRLPKENEKPPEDHEQEKEPNEDE